MAGYVVMEPPRATGAEAGAKAEFVRDGFSLPAFIAPVLWLLWFRLWLEAILVLLAAAIIAALGNFTGLASVLPALSLLVSAYIGVEGQAMRLARLRRRGWHEAAVIEAGNRSEAEIRYFSGAYAGQSGQPTERPAAPPATVQPKPAAGPALGLFEYPGN